MNSRICRCCGEPFHPQGNLLSRNPNLCASCSSLTDGMEESNVPALGEAEPSERTSDEILVKAEAGGLEHQGMDLATPVAPTGA
jgi:hypothetical protein